MRKKILFQSLLKTHLTKIIKQEYEKFKLDPQQRQKHINLTQLLNYNYKQISQKEKQKYININQISNTDQIMELRMYSVYEMVKVMGLNLQKQIWK
ncbi:unnamed protein product [Paramecium sonneborni]|uniref:Uncharacterized protein n=1 Tax=Paramecium sonneborni TaxID=65129 RepID=A0A8S1MAP2_9CILI|nr:unnamed protein product [Paramecium sonneborni]